MVEGHQCHRVGHAHRKQLMGQRFIAQSPNGRFTEGASFSHTPTGIWFPSSEVVLHQLLGASLVQLCQVGSTLPIMALTGLAWLHKDGEGCHAGAQAINQQPLSRIEVHGKNLFYFFGEGDATVVLHIHFGMSGRFKTVVRGDTLPEPRETTRLVLIGDKVVGQLSAMIVQHGGLGAHASSDESERSVLMS